MYWCFNDFKFSFKNYNMKLFIIYGLLVLTLVILILIFRSKTQQYAYETYLYGACHAKSSAEKSFKKMALFEKLYKISLWALVIINVAMLIYVCVA